MPHRPHSGRLRSTEIIRVSFFWPRWFTPSDDREAWQHGSMTEGDQSSRSIGLCPMPTQPTPEISNSNELRPAISHAGAVTPGMEPPIGASATTQARRDQLATRMFPGPVRTLVVNGREVVLLLHCPVVAFPAGSRCLRGPRR